MLFDDLADLAREADPQRLVTSLEALTPHQEARASAPTVFRRTPALWQSAK